MTSDLAMQTFLDGRVTVIVGDITKQDVEAIVNAANSSLLGGGGVDGAIHRAGGPAILEECREIRRTRFPQGLPTGEAVVTTGGKLPALYVIHTVGPIYGEHGGKEAELLADCYHNSLTLAVEKNVTSVAFPSIATGIGAALHKAGRVRRSIRRSLRRRPDPRRRGSPSARFDRRPPRRSRTTTTR